MGNSALLCLPNSSLNSMLWTKEGHDCLDISVFHTVFISPYFVLLHMEAWQQLSPFYMPSKDHGEFFSLGPSYYSAYWPYVEVKRTIFRNLHLSNEFHTLSIYVVLNSMKNQSNSSNNVITLSLLPSWIDQ